MRGTMLPLFAMLSGPVLAQECPATLDLKVAGLSSVDAAKAQSYANCLGMPRLPISKEATARFAQCKLVRPERSGRRLAKALTWIDQQAVRLSGCETTMKIVGK